MRKQNGFTLIEVLVTLVIVSLGLLGIVGIIANSLKVNQSANSRTQASWLANDIIDRMRANRETARITPAAYTINFATCAAIPAAGTVAQTDLNQWCGLVTAALPAGTGSVAFVTTPGTLVVTATVTVQWNDAARLAAGAVVANSGQVVVETQL